MAPKRDKVVVAMSGGVDSSVAACLLVEQGYDVMGLFMRVGAPEEPRGSGEVTQRRSNDVDGRQLPAELGRTQACQTDGLATGGRQSTNQSVQRSHQGCCSASDAADARYVAGMLGIPFYALNFEREFDRLIDYFADEYVNGRTPNPCVMCNKDLKFGKIVEYADAVGARYVATGHYARVAPAASRSGQRRVAPASPPGGMPTNVLLRARDERKDQSYVLFGLNREMLDRALFPIGDLTKPQVREIAARYGLPNQNKPDSVEICFVPDRDYARIVKQRRPEGFVEGNVLDDAGEVIGRHHGIGHYTIGQRRGLGIALGDPHYVTQLNTKSNTVTLGKADALLARSLIAKGANLLVDMAEDSFRALVKIRYLHAAVPATVYRLIESKIRIVFEEPQRAVTPGQAVVCYDGDLVLGGGWIERSET